MTGKWAVDYHQSNKSLDLIVKVLGNCEKLGGNDLCLMVVYCRFTHNYFCLHRHITMKALASLEAQYEVFLVGSLN